MYKWMVTSTFKGILMASAALIGGLAADAALDGGFLVPEVHRP